MAKRRFRRAVRRYRRYKPRRRRRKGKKISLLPTIAFASLFTTPAPSGNTIANRLKSGDFEGALYDAREKFVGIDNQGHLQVHWLIQTWGPMVLAGLVSKFVGKFVNHHLDKIPVIGKYLKL